MDINENIWTKRKHRKTYWLLKSYYFCPFFILENFKSALEITKQCNQCNP